MSQRVLMISGRKQSGKSSLRNYIMGVKLVDNGVLSRFNISTKGDLMVPTVKGPLETMECLDLCSRDIRFFEYAYQYIWPHCKNYSFANYLKYICIDLFGLSYEQCFGTDDEKATETSIRWSDLAFALPPRRVGVLKNEARLEYFLTARELMEEFGTNICRKIYYNCWALKCLNEVKREQYPFVIIDDCRYPNELELFREDKDLEVLCIRLLRNPMRSESEPETAMDNYDQSNFDLVIPAEANIVEKQNITLEFLREKEWL